MGDTATKSYRIVELQAENVKRLKAVSVKPTGDVVVVSGKNGQGKTSLLDSIVYALGGKETHATEVIRRGEEQAQVVLDLGELIIERKWRKGEKGETTTVAVKAKDGARYQSPQAILDGLYSRLTFDPLAFMRLEPAKQLLQLKELAGLNFGPLDGKRADLYDKRTEVNRQGQDLVGRFKAMAAPPADLPSEPVDVDALLAEQKAYNEKCRGFDALKGKHENLLEAVEPLHDAVTFAEKKLVEAQEYLESRKRNLRIAEEQLQQIKVQVQAIEYSDTTDITGRLRSAQTTNLAIVRERDRKKLEAELESKRAEAKKLNEAIEAVDAEKSKQLAAAKFPVPSLGLGAAGPTFNGLPLEQASSAEQLRVSVAMGLAVNPTLRVLLVRDGSLLDAESMAMLEKMAVDAGAQVWVERVADKGGVGVVIEDGSVAAGGAQ